LERFDRKCIFLAKDHIFLRGYAMKRLLFVCIAAMAMVVAVAAQAPSFLQAGASLYWQASTGDSGAMKVKLVSGQYFEVEQFNDKNKAAGAQKLYGAILDSGKRLVLMNVGNWKEVWDGAVAGKSVSGSIGAGSAKYSFSISAESAQASQPAAISTAPFVAGKTLKWKTNASGGQNGTLKVTSVTGAKFNLEQQNDKNKAAGVTKLDGEVKDGKFYIYNRKWNETWVGSLSNGAVSGKINNAYTFQIFE